MVVHSDYTMGSRGMGIMLHRSLTFIIHTIHTDAHGSFAALTGAWEGKILNVMSIYIPPRLHDQILPKLGSLLLTLAQGILIAGGATTP